MPPKWRQIVKEAALMAATAKKGGTDNGRRNGKGRGRPRAEHSAQGVRVHAEGEPGQRSADEVAEVAGAGHGKDRRVRVRRCLTPVATDKNMPAVGGKRRGGGREMTADELYFLACYLGNGRQVVQAAHAAGLHKRTALRWLQPDTPIGAWLKAQAQIAFQTVTAKREELESLLVDNLLRGLRSKNLLAKEKAADLTARVLGLDRGGSDHDLSPGTKALFAEMGLALVAVATRSEIACVAGDGIPAD